MLRSPDDQTVMTVAAFMISFDDYVKIGALASSSTGSASASLTAAQGFDALAAAVEQHSARASAPSLLSTSVAFPSTSSSVNLATVRAALAELRRTVYAMPRDGSELQGSSSASNAPVIVRATSVGENFQAWLNYWDGIPVGDWGLGTRSWLFWLFRTSTLPYCLHAVSPCYTMSLTPRPMFSFVVSRSHLCLSRAANVLFLAVPALCLVAPIVGAHGLGRRQCRRGRRGAHQWRRRRSGCRRAQHQWQWRR
jgi:hypothetical protein